MEEKSPRFEDLRLLPGQPLQLDFDGYSTERDKSILLGFRSGHSLMVTGLASRAKRSAAFQLQVWQALLLNP